MKPAISLGSAGDCGATRDARPRASSSDHESARSGTPRPDITTTCVSAGSEARSGSICWRIASSATSNTFAPQSARMNCHSRGSCASYIGT